MNNNSIQFTETNGLYDIHYANYLAFELYDVDIQEDKFEDLALIAYGKIGNKICKTYRYFTCIDPHTLSVELPCNFTKLISVCGILEDWERVTNKDWNGDPDSFYIEHYIERSKIFTDPLYQSGKFIHFEQIGNTLYFDKPYGPIGILYKGEVLDDNGLPRVNEKEANAIAAYVAYTLKYKEGLKTNNANIIQIAKDLQSTWNNLCSQAQTPIHINQNEMDEILDAKTNWNRKQFGKTLKPII